MGYNQSIDSSYMFMPSYNFGMYGLNNPAAYNYCAYTNPSIYSGGFNPMFGCGNYMTPTMPFTFNGLSSTTSNKTVPTLAGTDLSTISHKGASAEAAATTPDLPAEEPEKKEGRSVWGKIGIGLLVTAVVVGLGLGADHLWNGGKCRKAIGDWFKNIGKAKPEGEPTKPEGNGTQNPVHNSGTPDVNPWQESKKFTELLNNNPEEAYKLLENTDKSSTLYSLFINNLNDTLHSKFNNMSVDELSKFIEKADKSRAEEYFYAMKALVEKQPSKESADKLIAFLSECEAGTHNLRLISMEDLNKGFIQFQIGETYYTLAQLFKNEKNLEKEFECLSKIQNWDTLKVRAAMAENCIQRGQSAEGLKWALDGYNNKLKDLTNILLPNKETVEEAAPIMEEMAKACEKTGNTDLAKTIRLVMKGGLEGEDKLAKEEIEFLTNNNISFEAINNADGSFTFPKHPYKGISIKIQEYFNSLSV